MTTVCGTDFSIHAAEAATVAAILTARAGGTLTLVHASECAGIDTRSPDALAALEERGRAQLNTEAERLRKLGATVRTRHLPGSPSSVLLDVAAQSKARLMVVSSLGHFPPSRWLVGSVAERLAQNSTIPTLVVRADKPFAAWAAGKRALRVLVGYDFSASADAALGWVEALGRIGRCRITVAYLAWAPEESWRLGVRDDWAITDNAAEITKYIKRDLKERCRDILGTTNVQIRIGDGWGPAGPELVALAKAESADLIVVGTNQRRGLERLWLGSVSRAVLHRAPVSVACIPLPSAEEPPAGTVPEVRRVLVPTDFSTLGNQAIPYAYAALRRGGEVCLMHVAPPLARRGGRHEQLESQRAARESSLSARLRQLIPPQAKALGLRTHVQVVDHANPATAICQAAERFGASLICMSSRGRSRVAKALLGSVAQAVMTGSRRPVLILRDYES
ncbi:MAG TPA: universal stress protein [Candidatus Paceibacterota bacterium]|nr:universal stress protein [Candidatus Paceibacterota bacterium]